MSSPETRPEAADWDDLVDRLLPETRPRERLRATPPLPPDPRTPTQRQRAWVAARAPFAATLVFSMLLALLLGWVATAPSPAVSPDSIQYLSAAQNLASGRGAVTTITSLELPQNSVPFTTWPPLFPLLLSWGVEEGRAPIAWARTLQLLILVLSFLPLAILSWWVAGPRWAWLVLAIAACSRPWLQLSSFVWSESLFLGLTLVALVCLVRGVAAPRTEREARSTLAWLFAAGLFVSLATLTRYLGIAWIAVGVAVIVARCDDVRPRRAVAWLAAFILPASLPILAWCARNAYLTGAPFGEERSGPQPSLPQVLLDTLRTLTHDLVLPPFLPEGALLLGFHVAGIVAVGFLALCLVHRFGPQMMESGPPQRMVAGTALALTAIVYLLAVVGSSFRFAVDPINTRLLAPLYPAVWILAVMCLRGIWSTSGPKLRAGVALSAGFLIAMSAAAGVRYATAPRETRDLTQPYWRTVLWSQPSETDRSELETLRGLPEDALVVSNVWERVALNTGLAVKPLPGDEARDWPGSLLQHENAYVLVDLEARPERKGASDLEAIGQLPPGIVPVAQWKNARLYKVRSDGFHRGAAPR